jgi:hypothetical protein
MISRQGGERREEEEDLEAADPKDLETAVEEATSTNWDGVEFDKISFPTHTVGEDSEAPSFQHHPLSTALAASQNRMEEYERQNGPLPGNEKISEWICNMETLT